MAIAGFITFLTRFSMISLIKKESLSQKTRIILSYVPTAVFPSMIFPAIFLDTNGFLDLANNSKIIASLVAVIIGHFSRSVTATIFSGLISYWFLIFLVGY